MNYNFIQFNKEQFRGNRGTESYVSLNSGGILYLSSKLIRSGFANINDKFAIFYDKKLEALKLVKDNNSRNRVRGSEYSQKSIGLHNSIASLMPIGRYFQTEDKNIFKLLK